jgi:hypothetical protein
VALTSSSSYCHFCVYLTTKSVSRFMQFGSTGLMNKKQTRIWKEAVGMSWWSSKLLYDWQSVCLGIEHPWGTCDQILLPVGMLLYEICGLVSVERPLWREDGSAICSVITHWSESRRTRNHTLLSSETPPKPRCISIHLNTSVPSIHNEVNYILAHSILAGSIGKTVYYYSVLSFCCHSHFVPF